MYIGPLESFKETLFTIAIARRFKSSNLLIIKPQPPCLTIESGFCANVLMLKFNN